MTFSIPEHEKAAHLCVFVDAYGKLVKIRVYAEEEYMSEIKIPTIEEIINADAYEARMHFLYPDHSKFGGHVALPGQVSAPTPEAVAAELPHHEHPGLLLWVTFTKPEAYGELVEGKPRITRRMVGSRALCVQPNEFRDYDEVTADDELDTFIKLWLGIYTADRQRGFDGTLRHPTDDIHELVKQSGVRTELAELKMKARREAWDESIVVEEVYIAELFKAAQQAGSGKLDAQAVQSIMESMSTPRK